MKESLIVKKSNIIARAKRSPDSVWLGRLVAVVASQVHITDTDFKEYEVPVAVLMGQEDGSAGGKGFYDVIGVAKKAIGTIVEIQEDDEWVGYSLFSRCQYKKGSGVVVARFDPGLKKHFLNLKNHFTQYTIAEYFSLTTSYCQSLYEFLQSWKDRPHIEPTITELHEFLNTPKSLRSNFAEFERKVLKKAHKIITEKTTLKYEYETINLRGKPRKTRQKAVKIRFTFGKKNMANAKAKKKQENNLRQQKKDNKLFKQAIKCAAAHEETGCGELKGTKPYCKACFISD